MKLIDFLPPRYRERRRARHSHLWRLLVVAAFGAAVGAAAVGQQWFKNSAAAKVAAVEVQHAVAAQTNSQFNRLQNDLAEVRASAQLYAYLEHPWPRTQILAALAESLPPEVTLTEVSIARESLESAQRSEAGRERRRRETETDDARLLPQERDLKRLREEHDKSRTVVRISGRTSSIDTLNRYVASLAESPLAAQAELSSLESAGVRNAAPGLNAAGLSEFHLRILIVAAHGQSAGPRKSSDRVAAQGGDQ